jgi:spermidine synthase
MPAPPFIFSFIRFLLSFALVLIPTILMGGTLPIMGKLFVNKEDSLGWNIGSLYSISTFGGALGCWLSGFFLFRIIGLNQTLYLAGAINLLIGLIAFILEKRRIVSASPRAQSLEKRKIFPPLRDKIQIYPPYILRLVLWVFFVSGFAALTYEILWTRIFVMFFGHTVYAFSAMLTAFLCGLALGGWLFAAIIDKSISPLSMLGWLEVSIGLAAMFTLLGSEQFSHVVTFLQLIIGKSSPLAVLFSKFIASFLIMLPATTLLGGSFPVVAKIYARNIKKVGEKIGGIYSTNTIGAIFGSIWAGFVLIPLAGLQRGVIYTALLNIALGTILILANPYIKYRYKGTLLLASLSVFLFSFTFPREKPIIMSTEAFVRIKKPELLYYKEGIGGTVSVIRSGIEGDNERTMVIDGLSTCGNNLRWDQLVGYLPLLLHPNPKSVLIVGLGGGYTLEAVAKNDVEQIDCVEVSPDVVDASQYFPKEMPGLLEDRRIKIIIDDGRHHILTTAKKYDLIINDAFVAIQTGQGLLDTKNYYSSCLKILKEEGIFCQILGPVGENLKTQLKTVTAAFPHVTVWRFNDENVVFILASKEQLKIDTSAVMKRIQNAAIRADLKKLGIVDLPILFGSFVMNDEEIYGYTLDANVSTDNHPYIDFSAFNIVHWSGSPSTPEELTEFADYIRPLAKKRHFFNRELRF